MQYDKEYFCIGTFRQSSENIEDMLSYLESVLGSSPQFLKCLKNASVLNENAPVKFKQTIRATAFVASTQEELFPITPLPTWELSYIGSKVEDFEDKSKGYGVLSYNISDCKIYDDPQKLVKAMGYNKVFEAIYHRVIYFEMQEKDFKLLVTIKPLIENEDKLQVNYGEKDWVLDDIKKDLKAIKQAGIELVAKCTTDTYKDVMAIFVKIIMKLRRFIEFKLTVTDDSFTSDNELIRKENLNK